MPKMLLEGKKTIKNVVKKKEKVCVIEYRSREKSCLIENEWRKDKVQKQYVVVTSNVT